LTSKTLTEIDKILSSSIQDQFSYQVMMRTNLQIEELSSIKNRRIQSYTMKNPM